MIGWSGERTACDVRAVMFDMDGTLVDSTPVVEHLWAEFAARYGIALEPLLAYSHGRQTRDTIAEFLPCELDRSAAADEFERRELRCTTGIGEVRGARRLMATLGDARIAVVTSAPRALARLRLTAAGLPVPTVLVTSEDVPRGKPDPAGYRRAAARLGLASTQCLAIEDAEAGIQAALASGALTLVAGSHRSPTTQDLPRVDTLAAIHAHPLPSGKVRLHWHP
jgi:sugar-phosphatase